MLNHLAAFWNTSVAGSKCIIKEVYLETRQTSNLTLFTTTANTFRTLTIFAKGFILDVRRASKPASYKCCSYTTCFISWSIWSFRKSASPLYVSICSCSALPFSSQCFNTTLFYFYNVVSQFAALRNVFLQQFKNVQKICTVIWWKEKYVR